MSGDSFSNRSIVYEDKKISYCLERKEVKNLNLRIKRDGSVYVSANDIVSVEEIDSFVYKKANYICKAVDKFNEIILNASKPKQYVSGETFVVLGRNLRLRVQNADIESISSDGVYIYLNVTDTEDFEKKQRIVENFLDKQRKEVFEDILSVYYSIFGKYGVKYPKLRIRQMDTRWGSCLVKKGIITLNKRLIEAPRNCIEYVVMHEYCHFIHPDHSKRFYNFLNIIMPDWRERKKMLDKYADFWL